SIAEYTHQDPEPFCDIDLLPPYFTTLCRWRPIRREYYRRVWARARATGAAGLLYTNWLPVDNVFAVGHGETNFREDPGEFFSINRVLLPCGQASIFHHHSHRARGGHAVGIRVRLHWGSFSPGDDLHYLQSTP